MRLLLFFLLNVSLVSSALPSHCQQIVQDPVTKVFHPVFPICYEHVKKEIDTFCKGFQSFEKIPVDRTFIISHGSSGVVYSCVNRNGTVQAVFQHCRTPTGGMVKEQNTESYNEQGDSTYCFKFATGKFPLLEFNNRDGCVVRYTGQILKPGEKTTNGEYQCDGDGKSSAKIRQLGCNTTKGFVKYDSALVVDGKLHTFCFDHLAPEVSDATNCQPEKGTGGEIPGGDEFTKDGGLLRYRCSVPKSTTKGFPIAKEEFIGCTSRKIVDPLKTPFIYRPGEVMKEYNQKCSPALKITRTGKEKYCNLNGIQFEMETWLRVLVQSRVGHFYFCENDNGRPKSVFRGCFKKDLSYMITTKLTSAQETEQKKCLAPLKDWKKISFGERIWPK